MLRSPKSVRLVGTGLTELGRLGVSATKLQAAALERALSDAKLELSDVDGLVAVPSLSEPRFMQAHFLATTLGLLPDRNKLMRTIDTGGAGPISALLEVQHRQGSQRVRAEGGECGRAGRPHRWCIILLQQ